MDVTVKERREKITSSFAVLQHHFLSSFSRVQESLAFVCMDASL
jgi:hypothetical protein